MNANLKKEVPRSWFHWTAFYSQSIAVILVMAATIDDAQSAPQPEPAFAKVGVEVVTQKEFDDAFALAAKRKFYHGTPPQAQVAQLQRDVGDQLVNNILLLKEAKRRGLKPDQAAITATLNGYDARYRTTEHWQKNRAQLLPGLKQHLEQESLLSQLETQIRKIAPPSQAAIKAYYASHPEKFTEPEQLRVSVVLLKVDPAAPKSKWDAARTEGQGLVKKLRAGADFAKLAKLHSGDSSAAKGGDMGYMHRGMLPEVAQEAIDKFKPGGITEPVTVLEGVAVFRLDERQPAKLASLTKAQERTRELWLREQSALAWRGLIERLRNETKITVDESRYLPLASVGGAAHVVERR